MRAVNIQRYVKIVITCELFFHSFNDIFNRVICIDTQESYIAIALLTARPKCHLTGQSFEVNSALATTIIKSDN